MKAIFYVNKSKNVYSNILMRFWDSKRIDQKANTGLKVRFNDWSASKQKIKLKANTTLTDFTNNKLDDLNKYVCEEYIKEFNKGSYIGKKWLKSKIDSFFNRTNENELHKKFFTAWIENFVKEAPKRIYNGKFLKERTIKNYTTALRVLKDYEEAKNIKLQFENINLKFYNDFVYYCKTVKKHNDNTIGSTITRIKYFCRQIELEELPINPQFKHPDFKTISNKTKDIYLNEEEINKIFFLDLSKNIRLNNVRDLFIIGLRTGLRVSDFLRLQKINLKKDFITIETKKTNEVVTIPKHPQIKAILSKRNGVLPPTISEQNFNKYIKEICKIAGITELIEGAKHNPTTQRKENGIYPKNELVTSHICRRSFATNLYLTKGVKKATIMAITGHKSEKQFESYIKASNLEHAKILQTHFDSATESTKHLHVAN